MAMNPGRAVAPTEIEMPPPVLVSKNRLLKNLKKGQTSFCCFLLLGLSILLFHLP